MPDDIEDFLRRVMDARQAKGQRQQPQRQQQRPPQQRPPRPQEANPVEVEYLDEDLVEIVEPPPIRPTGLGGALGQHVSQYLDTSDIAEHTSHLGEIVGLGDDNFEARLEKTFHRDEDEPDVHAARVETIPAAELAMALRDPKTLRQAMLLNEILRRPEHFWE